MDRTCDYRLDESNIATFLREEYKIGEGEFRLVYRAGDKALKVLKPTIERRVFGITLSVPHHLYSKWKLGVPDFNWAELENYSRIVGKLPSKIYQYLIKIDDVVDLDGKTVSICQLVQNEDGEISQPIRKHGKIGDACFWNALGELEEALLDAHIYSMAIGPDNILVQKTGNGPKPVLVDYKRIGLAPWQVQVWLSFESFPTKKMKERFAQLKRAYFSFA